MHPNEIIREAVTLKHRRFNTALNLDVIAKRIVTHGVDECPRKPASTDGSVAAAR